MTALPVRGVVEGIDWPAIPADPGAHLGALLFQLGRTERLAPGALAGLQLGQLRRLLAHACSNVPFYRDRYAGLEPSRLDWEGFRTLPVLMRRELQAGFERLQSGAVPRSHGAVTEGRTSGSTGMPVRFLQTAVSQLFWNVLTLREHLWQGRDFSGKLAAIRVKVEDGRWPDWGPPAALLFRTGPGATLNVRTDVGKQLDWLMREDPDYLITHASNLHALAELSLKRGIRLPRLRQARSYSEALRPDLREIVRTAWGVEVADGYSCEEAGYIALQCPQHEHYHVQAENLVVEVLDEDDGPCAPGETGRVVLTTLHNFAMPLIRYELGDYAEAGGACDCGRGLPVLRRILGRQRNMLVLPDGRRHWPSFPAQLWRQAAPIEQFQLVQEQDGSLAVRYVMAQALTPAQRDALERALAERFGHRFTVRWQRVEEIARGAGGKYEDFVSLLA